MVLSREDMDRKNRRAREMRAERRELKKTQQEQQEQQKQEDADAEPQQLPPDYDTDNESNENVETNIPKEITYEEKEEIRRKEVAEKRRASLALARSKIKSRSSIRQEANNEIEKIKEENDKLKKDAEIQKAILEEQRLKPTIIKKYIRSKPSGRSEGTKKEAQPQPVPQPDPSINYLAEQSYAEQLQIKLRENMINKIMMDTFM